jgi:hypothetical protein
MKVLYQRGPLQGADLAAFDEFVEHAGGTHYMQASRWNQIQYGGHAAVRHLIVRDGKRVIGTARMLRGQRHFLRSPDVLIERGPVVDNVNDLDRVIPAIVRAARMHGIDQLRIQPYWVGDAGARAAEICAHHGFVSDAGVDGPHTETLRLALTSTLSEEIFATTTHASLRKHGRYAGNQGLVVRQGTSADLATLAQLDQALMEGQGAEGRGLAHFLSFAPLIEDETAALFCGEHDGATEAMVLVCRHKGQTTFHAGASSATKRPYKKMVLPLMAAAAWGAVHGSETFDLGGVPAARDTDTKRKSIAQFKYYFSDTNVVITPVMFSPTTSIGRAAKAVLANAKRLRSKLRS